MNGKVIIVVQWYVEQNFLHFLLILNLVWIIEVAFLRHDDAKFLEDLWKELGEELRFVLSFYIIDL